MRALQRRILALEIKHFPQYYDVPELAKPKGTLTAVLKDYYKPEVTKKVKVASNLLGETTLYTLDNICKDYFLPVAESHACGHLRLNTGREEFTGIYWAVVSCDGCHQTAYMKLDPRDYWTPSRNTMNTEGILYSIKSFFAVTVEDMHHAIEAS
jgi:hypothetical protein